jgi:putative SOS response-associated peptidase YedK
MSHAAQIWTDHREFEREFGAVLIPEQYVKFFRERIERGTWRKIPKGLKAAFAEPRDDAGRRLLELIRQGDADEISRLEVELFQQNARLAHAERMLQMRTTEETRHTALGDRFGAIGHTESVQRRLADLRREELRDHDFRVQVGQYAPVMIMQGGRRTIVPMRYQCRRPGWTAFVERQYPDTYHAHRSDLQKTWPKLFGHRHGILVVTRFYETLARHKVEDREQAPGEQEESVVLEFNPHQAMLVPCLWNFSPPSTPEERDIFSFAAVVDESPVEVAAVGHRRCVVPIKRENLEAWLNPDPNDPAGLYAILDNRERPSYRTRRVT